MQQIQYMHMWEEESWRMTDCAGSDNSTKGVG